MARLSIALIVICCIISAANAQDSSKKFKPVKTYKPYAKPVAYPAAAKPAYQQPVYARQDTGTIPKDQSLSGQYKYLLQPLIAALWKNASDTLNLNKHKLKDAQAKLGIQNKAIDSLKAPYQYRANFIRCQCQTRYHQPGRGTHHQVCL